MRSFSLMLSVCLALMVFHSSHAQKANRVSPSSVYFPPPGSWESKTAADLGLNPAALREVISAAGSAESSNPRSMEENHYRTFGREPFGMAVGPMKDRGNQTGILIHKGFVVAVWGEPDRPDMTHSVTKSFLSTVTGLAFDRRLISSVNDSVAKYVPPFLPAGNQDGDDRAEQYGRSNLVDLFSSTHNRGITWDHLLRQTSDWEGTLWGKPEWADRPTGSPEEWRTRLRLTPGTAYEYNDVRVNVLALATLMVWRKPLPQVLKENVMDPIGASSTWRWYGYDNSWVVLDGQLVQSVSGGGHWGGGMIINAWDMARYGYLLLRGGKWKDRQLLSPEWMRMSSTPTSVKSDYGHMNWFLNTDRKFLPSAPASAVTHVGNGGNYIYVDTENDIVFVCRWVDPAKLNDVVAAVLKALNKA